MLKKTSIYLDEELDHRLARRAADEGITKAEFIRRTLAGAVQRPKRARPEAVGVDAAKANAFARGASSQQALGAANSLASQLAVDSTPTILVGKRGGGVAKVNVDPADTAGYEKAIDALLGGPGA